MCPSRGTNVCSLPSGILASQGCMLPRSVALPPCLLSHILEIQRSLLWDIGHTTDLKYKEQIACSRCMLTAIAHDTVEGAGSSEM